MSLSTLSSNCRMANDKDAVDSSKLDDDKNRHSAAATSARQQQHNHNDGLSLLWFLDDTLASLSAKAGYTCLLGPTLDEHYPISWRTGDLAWVLKSKGRRSSSRVCKDESADKNNDTTAQRLELFLRGRIIDNPHAAAKSDKVEASLLENSSQRLWIQYPKGSTYHVKRDRLLRILPRHQGGLILTWPETDVYRRSCLTHTWPTSEGFCEIGCDHGPTIHRVASWLVTTTNNHANVVLGIDKAEDSIASARQRYPQYTFCQWDCLQPGAVVPTNLQRLIQTNESFHLAIDIGGNRDLSAVLQCLRVLLIDFKLRPRLVFVKSRALFQELSRRETERKFQDGLK